LIAAGKFLSRNQASAIAIFPFDEVDKNNVSPSKVSASAIQAGVQDPLRMPTGNRFLDEVEEDERNASTLHGDAAVEAESDLRREIEKIGRDIRVAAVPQPRTFVLLPVTKR
jgi:hypothetical protein